MSIIMGPYEKEASLQAEREDDELLVFGYACKLFRDDTKALLEASGQLLIPWMGDGSLMVDRSEEGRLLNHVNLRKNSGSDVL